VVKLPFVKPQEKQQERRVVQKAPRTQDQVLVAAALDDVLILRNTAVVAALEVESVDDALLSPEELESRLAIYRYDLLKQVRFDFQFLIGTRPQDLTPYFQALAAQAERWATYEARLNTMLLRLDALLEEWETGKGEGGEEEFARWFGFRADELWGVPGEARDAALALSDPEMPARWRAADGAVRSQLAGELRAAVLGSQELVQHYQSLIHERAAFLQVATQQMQAPIRTFHVVTSYYPRPLGNGLAGGPLSEGEIARAREELDKRCSQIARVLARMRLGAQRVSGAALLELVRAFYHPSSAQMRRREERG
jgi:hypothetical protein